jgi:citrate lyase subunit beta/citryl-CoA lyase
MARADRFSPETVLFVPADDERKATKALQSSADAVILDLEDAVADSRKDPARRSLAALVQASSAMPAFVRVNGADTPHLVDDLATLAGLTVDGIVLPKATPATLAALPDDAPPVIAIVESAAGLLSAAATAADSRVVALMLGPVDLGLELGLERRADGLELLHARSTLVLASAAAQIARPIDGVYPHLADDEGLSTEAALARSLGMGGKACVHPRQLDVVREAFAGGARISWARRVVEAYDAAPDQGVIDVDGEMVDLPVVERARRILAATTPS